KSFIDILPLRRKSIPLSWFSSNGIPLIVPLIEDERTKRLHDRLDFATLIGKNNNNSKTPTNLITPIPFYALHKLLRKLRGRLSSEYHRFEVAPFLLTFKRILMFYGFVTVTEVPTKEPNQIATKYVFTIEPMLYVQNVLSYPITMQI
ncbi:hypothetical protein IE077_002515, partial [Cardiosporidium cionae]